MGATVFKSVQEQGELSYHSDIVIYQSEIALQKTDIQLCFALSRLVILGRISKITLGGALFAH